jgi:Spy/CpxP family protein refolding chaperone
MRRIALGVTFLAVTMFAVSTLIGEDKKPDPKDPDPKLKGTLPKNYKQLGLSDEQKQAIFKVHDRYQAKIEDLEKKIKELKGEREVGYEKVLTKAQLDRLKELRDPTKDRPKDGDKDKPKDGDKDKPKDGDKDKPKDKPKDGDKDKPKDK